MTTRPESLRFSDRVVFICKSTQEISFGKKNRRDPEQLDMGHWLVSYFIIPRIFI